MIVQADLINVTERADAQAYYYSCRTNLLELNFKGEEE